MEVIVDGTGTNFSIRCQCGGAPEASKSAVVINDEVVSSECTCSFRINGHEVAPIARYTKLKDETQVKAKPKNIRAHITGPLPYRDPQRMFGRISQLTIEKSTLDQMRTSKSNNKLSCYINHKGLYRILLSLTAMGWYYLIHFTTQSSTKDEVEIHVEEDTITLSTICRCGGSGNACGCHFVISKAKFETMVYRIKP